MAISWVLLCLVGVALSSAELKLTNGDYLINVVNSKQSTWKAHHNFKRDVLPRYAEKLASRKVSTAHAHSFSSVEALSMDDESSTANIPDSFDARDQWANCSSIGEVRDQGPCSSGWAIATVTALTDRFCIASYGEITTELSVQDLLECCSMCGDCESGDPKLAWYYIAFNGLVTGGDYGSNKGCKPYTIEPCEHSIFKSSLQSCGSLKTQKVQNCRKKCSMKNYRGKYATDVHFVKVVQSLNSVSKIQSEIMTNGPVQATMNVYEDMFYYKSGVYSNVVGSKIGNQSVKIIGWGVEGDGKSPYWLVVNSWNSNWGEKGLFKIVRGQNECGIETSVYAPTPDLSI